MKEQSRVNKQAWDYRAYEFWEKRDGTVRTSRPSSRFSQPNYLKGAITNDHP
ncbi:hypothetical protein [Exiguobacterium sp.]|uniref:hypothetical protein n=1 Tax=Exiguobacterium sp. TaxID=44751 RepID=UPI00289D2AF1|nr:hypothetical protein [Exiguobacterium sp.]